MVQLHVLISLVIHASFTISNDPSFKEQSSKHVFILALNLWYKSLQHARSIFIAPIIMIAFWACEGMVRISLFRRWQHQIFMILCMNLFGKTYMISQHYKSCHQPQWCHQQAIIYQQTISSVISYWPTMENQFILWSNQWVPEMMRLGSKYSSHGKTRLRRKWRETAIW